VYFWHSALFSRRTRSKSTASMRAAWEMYCLSTKELATIEVTPSYLYRLKVHCSAPVKGKKATQKSAAATRSKRATSKEAVAPVALVARRTTRQSSTEPLLQLANPNLADGTESEQDTRTDARYFSRSSCLDNTSQGYRVCSLITYSSVTPFVIKEETQVEVFERVPRQERGTSTGTARSHCQAFSSMAIPALRVAACAKQSRAIVLYVREGCDQQVIQNILPNKHPLQRFLPNSILACQHLSSSTLIIRSKYASQEATSSL
jgi:hypothetical protein